MMGFVMVVIGKWSKVVVFALELSFPILYSKSAALIMPSALGFVFARIDTKDSK